MLTLLLLQCPFGVAKSGSSNVAGRVERGLTSVSGFGKTNSDCGEEASDRGYPSDFAGRFCQDRIQAFCESESLIFSNSQAFDELRTRLIKTALLDFGRNDLHLPHPEILTIEYLMNLQPKELRTAYYTGYFRALERALAKESKGESLLLKSDFELSRSFLSQALTSSASILSAVRDQMNAKVLRVRLGVVEDLAQNKGSLERFLMICGPDGMEPDAFMDDDWREGETPVFICPGTIAASLRPGRSRNIVNRDGFIFTMGHELGHSIDWERFPDAYKKMKNCLERKYWQGDNPIKEYMIEMSADHWGAEVLGRYLKEKVARNEREQALISSIADLCRLEANENYPSGEFRIGVLLRRNLTLESSLGCRPVGHSEPRCDLEGR